MKSQLYLCMVPPYVWVTIIWMNIVTKVVTVIWSLRRYCTDFWKFRAFFKLWVDHFTETTQGPAAIKQFFKGLEYRYFSHSLTDFLLIFIDANYIYTIKIPLITLPSIFASIKWRGANIFSQKKNAKNINVSYNKTLLHFRIISPSA